MRLLCFGGSLQIVSSGSLGSHWILIVSLGLVSSECVVEFDIEIHDFDATPAERERFQLGFTLSFLFLSCWNEQETQMKAVIASEILGMAKGRSEVTRKKGPKDGIRSNNKSKAVTVCLEVIEDGEMCLSWHGLLAWWWGAWWKWRRGPPWEEGFFKARCIWTWCCWGSPACSEVGLLSNPVCRLVLKMGRRCWLIHQINQAVAKRTPLFLFGWE